MKKIAFVFDLAYPFTKGGGEKRVYDFAKTLSNIHEVDILCMKWWEGKDRKEMGGVHYIAICPKVELYSKSGKRKLFPSVYFGLKTFLYLLRHDYDVVDFEVFPYFPLIFGKIAKKIKKNKFVIVGNWCECQDKIFWKKYSPNFWWMGEFLEYLCYSVSDKSVAISDFTADKMEKKYGRNKEIKILSPLMLDKKLIDSIENTLVKIYDLIYFGRLIRHKNIDKLLTITKKLIDKRVDVKTLIIGNGSQEQELKNIVQGMKLEKNVVFLDFIDSYEDLIRHIKMAKIFVFPSEREGFGISVVEANACGLPALVMNYSDNATKDLVKNGENGFVCEDYNELIQKAILLIGDKIKLKEMSQCAKNISLNYDREKNISAVLHFYQSI
ncbi:MAG: hypothetical protein C0412_07770 [Flavobacterium sp.]|nr:hypothetical protein [Flavobacterium sp.]